MGLFTDYNLSFARFYNGSELSAENNNAQNFGNSFPCLFDLSLNSSNPFTYFPPALNFPQFPLFNFTFPPIFPNLNFTQYTLPPMQDLSLQTPPLISNPTIGDTFIKSTPTKSTPAASQTLLNNTNNNVKKLSWWKAQGYNEAKGKKLAENTKRRSDLLKAKGIKSRCGQGVREGVNDTFYNGQVHHKPQGLDAKDFGDKYFAHDTNLKKIDVRGMNLSKKDIPAGVIVIYENYSSNPAGHIEVSDGKGHGNSDFESTLLQNHGQYKKPKEVWIPV